MSRPVSQHPVREMYALYEGGATLSEVGERFGVSGQVVGRLFKREGLGTRRGRPRVAVPVREMYALYEGGATLEVVGYKFSIAPFRLSALFREHGLVVRPRGTSAAERPIEEMYALYEGGASLREVGERFGTSAQLVGKAFRKHGLAIRKRGVLLAEYPVAEMYEMYKGGASLREVGERYGLNPFTISELFSRVGLPKRSDSKPTLSATEIEARKLKASPRVLEMYELYEHGATLEEIGDDFGISRERVRQLFKAAGLQTRTNSATATLKQAADQQRAEEIVDCFRRTKDLAAVAQELDIPKNTVTKVVRERFSTRQYRELTTTTKVWPVKFTDAELLGFLVEAHGELGGTLTGTAYNVLARDRRTADGKLWPSKQTYALRFGSWRNALITAQLDANPSSPVAGKGRFGVEQCAAALREAHLSLGTAPSRSEYEQHWRGTQGRLPSPSTVTKRCGSWIDALRIAGLAN